MIIVCPECSTRFNVNDERIPEGGAKVRCARCKHVFRAEPPAPTVVPEEVSPGEPSVQPEEEPALTEAAAATDESTDEPSFSYESFQELDSSKAQDETFTFSSEGPADEPEQESDFTFNDSTGDAETAIEKVIASTEEPAAEESVQQEETENEAELTAPAKEAEPLEEIPTQTAPPQKSGAGSLIRILLILILGILVIAGVMVYMNGPDSLNQTMQQLLGQQTERPVQAGRISLAKLEGRFIQNENAGELFLIRGEAINDFKEPRSGIQVKGVIFDQNGKPLLQKTVFCGNPITEKQLTSLSFPELEKIMGNQFGEGLRNMKIQEGQAIAFDIVFKDLPQNLSEYSVKVTASKPASK